MVESRVRRLFIRSWGWLEEGFYDGEGEGRGELLCWSVSHEEYEVDGLQWRDSAGASTANDQVCRSSGAIVGMDCVLIVPRSDTASYTHALFPNTITIVYEPRGQIVR